MEQSRRNRRSGLQAIGLESVKLPRMSDGETSIDSISALPDPILQHILSFLTVKDFIKTSVLSKRWRLVWAEVPVLRFLHDIDENTPRYERFITGTLAKYRGEKVQKLKISFEYERKFSFRVEEWICFAAKRKVEKLKVFLYQTDQIPPHTYQLPQSIYSNSSLQVLGTRSCSFNPSGSVSWASLKKLSIFYPKLSDDAIARILLGSPNLEYLKMEAFAGVEKIIVTSSNLKLKQLVLDTWGLNLRSPPNMEISAPYIHILSLGGLTRPRMIKLINLSSLVEFNFSLVGGRTESMICCQLPRVQKLSVNSGLLEILSTLQMPAFPSALNCKSLVIDSSVRRWDFQGIVTLLQAAPNLEKLKIMMDSHSFYKFYDKTEYWESLKTDVKCNHLRTVMITGFEQKWCVGSRLKFFTSTVEFLLKNATDLERMVIYAPPEGTIKTREPYKLPDLSEVNKLISNYPRASVVEFKTYFD